MGGEAVPVDELLKLQLQQQVIELRSKGAAEVVLRGEVQRGIGDDGGQIPGVLGALPALLQLFDDAGLGVDLRQQAVQLRHGMILLHQCHGGLFPHAGDAGDVVGGVAHEGLQVDHVDGSRKVSSVISLVVVWPMRVDTSFTLVWGVMSWRLSLSPVTMTQSQPDASQRRLMVPMRSSAS